MPFLKKNATKEEMIKFVKSNKYLRSIRFWKNKNKEMHTKLHTLLFESTNLLEINKLNPFLIFGSTLGAIRHKDIIPWDDDIDIGLIITNPDETFLKLSEIVQNTEYKVQKHPPNSDRGVKIFKNDPQCFIDIFYFVIEDDKVLLNCRNGSRKAWPGSYFYKKDFDKMQKVKFGKYNYKIPGNYDEYLIRMYGENYLTEYRLTHSHFNIKFNNFLQKYGYIEVDLESEDDAKSHDDVPIVKPDEEIAKVMRVVDRFEREREREARLQSMVRRVRLGSEVILRNLMKLRFY